MDEEKSPANFEVKLRETTIAFDPEAGENRASRHRRERRSLSHSRSRQRSSSRDSANEARNRIQASNYGIPIGYRTLSIQASESRARSLQEDHDIKKAKVEVKEPGDEWAQLDHHDVALDSLYQRLRTSPQVGLSSDAVAKRLQEDGYNTLPKQQQHYIRKLLNYVFGGFCSVLWIGVIVFFICWRPLGNPDPQAYNLGLGILVIIVILLQASFSAFQDWSTARTMNSILDLLPSDALLLRDGGWSKKTTKEVVPGDIVRVSIGDKVPADLRIIETSSDTRFDRSAITGESEEVEASLEVTNENILESLNMAWMGTIVTNGTATGIVCFTGERSMMGTIAKATTKVKEKPTAIQQEITRFVMIIVGLTIFLVLLIVIAWAAWLRVDHKGFLTIVDMLDDAMGSVVAFIPEGMPVAVALTLMMVARRMRSVNVLPKSLATVETLGCVQVLCSDKTGTLTKNQMSVVTSAFIDHSMTAEDAIQQFDSYVSNEALQRLCRAARLCNAATFEPTTIHLPISERLIQGNPTDGALLRFAEAANATARLQDGLPQVAQVAFNSKNKFMLTLHKPEAGEKAQSDEYLALLKGGPDVLLPKCTRYWSYKDRQVKDLDEEAKKAFNELQTRMSRNAERVILLCERTYKPSNEFGSSELSKELIDVCADDLTVIGVLGIFDPPRPETASTVADCRRAGIRFWMMTGDFGLTGAAIARQVGIFTSEREPDTFATIEKRRDGDLSEEYSNQSLLLEGAQISQLEDEDWNLVCKYEEIVFGRCSPEHKLRIVNELKARDLTTAVTGDGVNDAPALKAADVGIAMVNGSDVALEAAHLVLLDKFDSIVEGIRLGRLVFQNLQKVISYLLPGGSWSEIWPVLMNVFFGVPLPLSSFLMIIICVFTDLFCSLSLVMEKEEFDLLTLPPRRRKQDHLINLKIYIQSYLFIGVMETVVAHSMFFLYYWRHAKIPASALFLAYDKYTDGFYGYSQAELTYFNTVGQSVYFITVVILQWGNILSIRNKRLSILQADPIRKQRRNPWLILSIIISLSIAIFVTEEPGIQNLFDTAGAPIEFWLIPIPLALGVLFMDEMRKLLVRTWPNGPVAKISW